MPLSPSATRELLNRLGHQPKRFLGQNFLVDSNIVRKSLALAEVAPGERILEIGPGLGTLTSALLEAGAEVWAIERDARLHAHLEAELLERFPQTLHLMEGDAVEHPRAALPDDGGGFKVVANLPYAISTPWMDAILEGPLPGRLVLMLQLEAAARYGAKPGTKQFGAISIFLQSAYEFAPGHKVSPECFHPRPAVESYLMNLVRKEAPFRFAPQTKCLIRQCFQQRRKQIGSFLRAVLPDGGRVWIAGLEENGLGANARAEQIPVVLWQKLDATLRSPSIAV